RAVGDRAIAGKLDELEAALRSYDQLHKRIRELAMQASNERAIAMLGKEGKQAGDALQDALRGFDGAIADRSADAEVMTLHGEVWSALYHVLGVVAAEQAVIGEIEAAAVEAAAADAVKHNAELKKAIAAIEQGANSPEERRAANQVRTELAAFQDVHGKISAMARLDTIGQANELASHKGFEAISLAAKLA